MNENGIYVKISVIFFTMKIISKVENFVNLEISWEQILLQNWKFC
jgi:hypothetical protein